MSESSAYPIFRTQTSPAERVSAPAEISDGSGHANGNGSNKWIGEIDSLLRELRGKAEAVLGEKDSGISGSARERIEELHRCSIQLQKLFSNSHELGGMKAESSRSSPEGDDSRKTADRLALALSAGKLGDWVWDPDTDIMELSERAAEIYDVPFGSGMTRTAMRSLLHEEDRERARLAAEHAARTHTDYDIEYRLNLRDGRQRWVAAKGRAVVGEDGRLLKMLGVVQDITDRKQAEKALLDARARLDATLFAAEIGTWTWDLVSNHVVADKNLAQMFFGSQNDVADGPIHNFIEAIHPEDRERVQSEIASALESKSGELETDYRLCSPDGRIRWVTSRGKVQRDISGEPVQFPGVLIDITERKRQETAVAELSRKMEEQARLFDATLSNIPDLAYSFDREKRVIYANKALLDLWGVSLEGAVGKNCRELGYPEELVERLEGQMQAVFDTRKPWKDVTLFLGEYHEYIYSPVLGADGSVTAIVGTTRIITERKRLEAVAEVHRRVLQHIAEDASLEVILEELIHAVELQSSGSVLGSVLLLEGNGIRLRHGAAPSLPQTYTAAIDGVSIGPDVGSCGTAAWSKQPVYVADITTDPRWANYKELAATHGLRACWSTPIFSSSGEVLGTFAMYYREQRWPTPEDLSVVETATRTAAVAIQRKRAEKALRESEARFRNMADNAPVMVWVTEVDGTCSFLSKSWYEFTGQQPGEGLGFGWTDAVHPEDRERAAQAFQNATARRETFRVEFRLRRRDGEYRWALDAAAPRIASDGQFLGFIGSVIDLTEQKESEAKLRESKEAAEAAGLAKDRFLAVLSHELRTPLTPVLMAIAALEADPELPLAVREDLSMIRRNVELETKLIDDLLDLSRITSGKLSLRMEPMQLEETVRQVCGICRPQIVEKNIRLTLNLSAAESRVTADPARLQQVFWNVLKNAVKFTPEGGDITVSTVRSATGEVYVQIRDTGIGIEVDMQPRIFDAFEQGDPRITQQFGGLGLGLAISKALIEMHHGSIRVTSEGLGQGSTFTITLPTELPVVNAPSTETVPESKSQPTGVRVLLVEDHADTARLLVRLLCRAGYPVKTANTLAGALDLASKEPFDVIVSDLGLPDGTGYELIRKIRKSYGIKGIATSGFGMEEDIRKSKEAGFSEHLVKPLNLSQLQEAIERLAKSVE